MTRALQVLMAIAFAVPALLMAHAIVAAVLYFGMVLLSTFLPWPRFGITEEVAQRARMPGSSGLWVDQPHRAIGPAAVYFLLLGLMELALLSWIDPSRFA